MSSEGSAGPGIASLPEAAAIPRRNGELIFERLWESRAFGLVVALTEGSPERWERFRFGLIAEIAANPEHEYYLSWLGALEDLAVEMGMLSQSEIDRRAQDLWAGTS